MNGVYGTKRPANITNEDIEIFYHYRPNRNSEVVDFSGEWKALDNTLLANCTCFIDTDLDTNIPGLYDLRLPLDVFGVKGIYNVYIRPKEVKYKITDVSTLYTNPTIRGIVIESNEINDGDLVGSRVEYFDTNGKRTGEFRIITSNNKCEPVAQNLNDGYSGGVTYRFNNSSSLIFCTLTPSTAMSFKSTSIPYIGKANQIITIANTKFNPFMMEIEMVDKDISGVAAMLEGEQIRNLKTGTITTFKDGEIYHQAAYGNIVNNNTGINHDFKIVKETVDTGEKAKLEEIEKQL